MKSYMDCLDEITGDELYEGLLGYGMFAEKLPPVFSSKAFYDYCVANPSAFNKKVEKGYIYFESMRNTNVPRPLGIPTPMKYAVLCGELRDNWDEIRDVFRNNTLGDPYKVSRLHIRKRAADKALLEVGYGETEDEPHDYDQIPNIPECDSEETSLFCMNYKNWVVDGDPILDFSLGKKYVVKADISQCFPSIYTHAITWAIVGKAAAKANRSGKWYNKIDSACQKMRNGETHGLLIGPHASNLISELLLTTVDKALRGKGYDYIRNIDDYTCYTKTHEEAERFLIDLNIELRAFDFSINHKKTVIEELPQLSSEYWIQKLKDKPIIGRYDVVDFNTARSYIDTAVSLMQTNGGNASSLFYAIKILGNNPISSSAKDFCVKTMCNLAIIYPYLVPIMDQYVFDAFNASVFDIEAFAKVLYDDSTRNANFEGISYSLFYAIKYNFCIVLDTANIIQSTSCICKLMMLLYARKYGDIATETLLLDEARRLKATEFDENWVFIYEALTALELDDEWKNLKNAGVSFLTV